MRIADLKDGMVAYTLGDSKFRDRLLVFDGCLWSKNSTTLHLKCELKEYYNEDLTYRFKNILASNDDLDEHTICEVWYGGSLIWKRETCQLVELNFNEYNIRHINKIINNNYYIEKCLSLTDFRATTKSVKVEYFFPLKITDIKPVGDIADSYNNTEIDEYELNDLSHEIICRLREIDGINNFRATCLVVNRKNELICGYAEYLYLRDLHKNGELNKDLIVMVADVDSSTLISRKSSIAEDANTDLIKNPELAYSMKNLDYNMVGVIHELNKKGYRTYHCCSGHNYFDEYYLTLENTDKNKLLVNIVANKLRRDYNFSVVEQYNTGEKYLIRLGVSHKIDRDVDWTIDIINKVIIESIG